MDLRLALCLGAVALGGCSTFASRNEALGDAPLPDTRASFVLTHDRGEKDVLVLLALSGGGSRAAYFSGSVMLRLQQVFQDIDLLAEVDAISSVSGGSLPAAYYAVSKDPAVKLVQEPGAAVRTHPKLHYDAEKRQLRITSALNDAECRELRHQFPNERDLRQFERLVQQWPAPSNREWNEDTVKKLMSQDYISSWFGNWFWPDNIVLYWLTAYDRSDIMAQTFADNLFDVYPTGQDLRMRDLNPERPHLILNATNATEKVNDRYYMKFGSVFTFTHEDFERWTGSDILSYPVANAVMASAAFPAVFKYVTLRDYRKDNGCDDKKDCFLHVFDGGNADNLGLSSLKRIIRDRGKGYRKIVIILVDSYVPSRGVDRNSYEPRLSALTSVADATDSLLEVNRKHLLDEFQADPSGKLFFYHVRFEDSSQHNRLKEISTNFSIEKCHQDAIDYAVNELLTQENVCLNRIRNIVLNQEDPKGLAGQKAYCTWKAPEGMRLSCEELQKASLFSKHR
jgi:predicted acylesterase/phospholipase RssA